jgi:hypothetical protein
MNEAEIVARLRANIPTASEEPVVVRPTEIDTTTGQAKTGVDYPLDEITQYKLQDHFGVPYKPTDETTNQKVRFIYETVSNMVEDKEYGFVVAKIRELERMIGTAHSEDRVHKLYQWLRLEKMRKNIEAQQGAII